MAGAEGEIVRLFRLAFFIGAQKQHFEGHISREYMTGCDLIIFIDADVHFDFFLPLAAFLGKREY